MRLPETEESAIESDAAPTAGPSSIGLDGPKVMNGHMNGNGSVYHSMKGSSIPSPNGKPRRKPTVEEVVLPGTSFYTDDPSVNREHVVRLMIQSLRDVGYQYVIHPFAPFALVVRRIQFHFVQCGCHDPRSGIWLHDGSPRGRRVSKIYIRGRLGTRWERIGWLRSVACRPIGIELTARVCQCALIHAFPLGSEILNWRAEIHGTSRSWQDYCSFVCAAA